MARTFFAIIAGLTFCCGCNPIHVSEQAIPVEPITHGSHVAPKTSTVRRVLLVPIQNRTRYRNAGNEFTAELESQLQAAGLFEVVLPDTHHFDRRMPPVLSSRGYHEGIIADFAREYRVDAVMIAELSNYRPYWPQQAGIKLHIVEPEEATVIASVDGHWDANQQAVAAEMKYEYRQLETGYDVRDIEIANYSPRVFRSYVVRKIIESLGGKRPGEIVAPVEPCAPTPLFARPLLHRFRR